MSCVILFIASRVACLSVLSTQLYLNTGLLTLPFMKLYTSGMTDCNYINIRLPLLFIAIRFLSIARFVANNLINIVGHLKKTQNRAILEATINIVASVLFAFKFGIYCILFGTVAALLYRTNDFLLYSNRVILRESPIPSYRVWLSNLLTAPVCFPLFCNKIGICQSYLHLVVMGIKYSALIMIIFILGNLVMNFNLMKSNILVIKMKILRRKKSAVMQ